MAVSLLAVPAAAGQVPVSTEAARQSRTAQILLATSDVDLTGSASAQDLYLEVLHGERSTRKIARVRLSNGRLFARPIDLDVVGVVVPAGVSAQADADGLVPLEALPGLAYRYERATQRLFLQVPPALRPVQHFGYRTPEAVSVRRDQGLLLTYDAYARGVAGSYNVAVTNALRWFGRAGNIESTAVSRVTDGRSRYRRLDTRWTYSDPTRLWTWTGGDLVSGGTAWSRPVRLAGLQWRRNFGVRPDLITLPMPRFSTDAVVPSTVELFVNNVRQFGAEVQDGPFVLDALPRISGAGQASLVVTDALGRATQTTVSLYVDQQRLARGLTDFSVEAGVIRRHFGDAADVYGNRPVASVSWRRGLTDTVTMEGHGEGGSGVRLAGAGVVWAPGNHWGLATASYSLAGGERSGGQYSIGYQRNSSRYGFDLSLLRRDDGFRDLGDANAYVSALASSSRAQDRATFWVPTGRGSLGVTWLRWQDRLDRDFRTTSLSWTQNLGRRLSMSVSLFHDTVSGGGGGVSWTVPLGANKHAGTSVRASRDGASVSATASQNAPFEGGWGWNVRGGSEAAGQAQASASFRGRYGETEFGVDRSSGHTGMFAQGGGSVAMMDGRFFLSRRIHDSFAVVSTHGAADVQILTENRLYGRTDRAGYLLIPELRGWQRNRIGVEASDLGARLRIGAVEQSATPADHSGTLVRFDIVQIDPAIVVLLDADGKPLPPGSRVGLRGSESRVIVGFDGEAYVESARDAVLEFRSGSIACRYQVPPQELSPSSDRLRRVALPCEPLP